MLVRVVIGVLLAVLWTVGCYLLLLGIGLQSYAEAGDPPGRVIGALLWLGYLAALNLLWGSCAAAMLWPGHRSARFRRLLGYGGVAAGISGAALMAVAYLQAHGRGYIELAGIVLISGFVVGFGQALLRRADDELNGHCVAASKNRWNN